MRIGQNWRRVGAQAVALLACFAGAAAGASSPEAGSGFNRPQDVQQITAIENELGRETNVAQVLRHYASDAIVVTVWAPGWHEGTAQIRAALAARLSGLKRIEPHIDEMNVASDGTLACAASVVRFDAERQDGSRETTAVRQLDAFRKIGGRWRIVHQHISVPVDMATGTPLLDGPLGTKGPLAWAPVQPGVPQAPDVAKAAIRTWLEVNAVTPTVQEAMDTYGPSNDVILFDVASPGQHRGLDDLHAYFNATLGGVRGLEYKLPALSIDTDGQFGMQISRLDLKIINRDGAAQYMSFRQSDCLRRIGAKWYPFFEMGSFPIDPRTGKAIMAHPEAFAGGQ